MAKAFDNFPGRLHFVDRNRRAVRLELEQAAQGSQLPALVVDGLAELLIGRPTVGAGSVLELGDSIRVPLVNFAVPPPLVSAAGGQIQLRGNGLRGKGEPMPLQLLGGDSSQADASHPGGRPGKVLVNQILVQADGLENLSAAVALHGRYAHFGHYLEQALFVGFDVIFDGVVGIGAVQFAAFRQILHGIQCQVGVDRAGPVAQEQAEVVNFPGFAGFHDQANFGAAALPGSGDGGRRR